MGIVSWIIQVGPSIYVFLQVEEGSNREQIDMIGELAFVSFEDGKRGPVAKAPSRTQERQGMNPALFLQKMQSCQPLDFIFLKSKSVFSGNLLWQQQKTNTIFNK